MKIKNIPFNISFLSNEQRTVAGLLPVTDLAIYGDDGGFAKTGLYSDLIFGRVGTDIRNKRHGYINLKTKILHPKIYDELCRLGSLYKGIMSGKIYAIWDEKEKDFIKSDMLDGQTGYSFFFKHFNDIKFKKNQSQKRSLRVQLIEKYRHLAPIHYLIVLPAGLRDVRVSTDGRPIEDEINKFYRKVLILSKGIPEAMAFSEDSSMDRVRFGIQIAVQTVYDNIMVMISGKKGFLQDKWASRKVAHGTRNVISAMDPGSDELNGTRSLDINSAHYGLHQVLRGIEPITIGKAMPSGIASELINNADNMVTLVDKKTLQSTAVFLSEKERTKWATRQGRSDLIGIYEELVYRHRPITIDGNYLKLVYSDETQFKVFNDIRDLPKHLNVENVHPITWAEYFYLTIEPYVSGVRGFITRYPITGIESVHAVIPYLKTTVKSLQLRELNEDWLCTADSKLYVEFPDTRGAGAFMDASNISPSVLSLLGADFDGDFYVETK